MSSPRAWRREVNWTSSGTPRCTWCRDTSWPVRVLPGRTSSEPVPRNSRTRRCGRRPSEDSGSTGCGRPWHASTTCWRPVRLPSRPCTGTASCCTSLYLERNRELRCVAQRGLWQVLDGMPGTAGITGRTWATATSVVVEDVSSHPDYRVSVPGVVSEICVPILVNGEAVGSLNVESFSPLTTDTLDTTESVARLLADRLGRHRRQPRQLSMASGSSGLRVHLRAPRRVGRLPHQVLHRFADAAEMDSACLIIEQPKGRSVLAAVGPLAESLVALDANELSALSTLVGDIRSCYTAGDATEPGIRRHGVPAVRGRSSRGRAAPLGAEARGSVRSSWLTPDRSG